MKMNRGESADDCRRVARYGEVLVTIENSMKNLKTTAVIGLALMTCDAVAAERPLAKGYAGVYSPDGKVVAFEADNGARRQIGFLTLETGRVAWPELGGGCSCHPSFGADGALYYVCGQMTNTNHEIFKTPPANGFNVFRYRDGQVERLTSGLCHDMTPSISPDGKTLYFASTREDKTCENNSIFALDLADPAAKPRLIIPGTEHYCTGVANPTVSPDGKRILWGYYGGWTPPYHVMTAPLSCPTNRTKLTDVPEFAFAPRYDRTGRYVCYTSVMAGEPYAVRIIDLETRRVRKVANGRTPCFSPRGDAIVYERAGVLYESDFDPSAAESKKTVAEPVGLLKIALIDQLDYAKFCDVERASGGEFILDHVSRTGANVFAWRQQTGGIPRYRSAEDTYPLATMPYSVLRIPESRLGYAWLNLYRGETDLLRSQFELTASRGCLPAVHLTEDESHYFSYTFSNWNLEHPEFWCVQPNGIPWPGHASFSYDEVIAHRLRLLDEILDRGAQLVFFGGDRTAGYGPRFEYTRPSLAKWEAEHGRKAPEDWKDPAWVKHAGSYYERFIRALAARCHGRGVKIVMGIRTMSLDLDESTELYGLDWAKLCREKVVDGLAVPHVDFRRVKGLDPWEATDRIYAHIASRTAGVDLYLPVSQYPGTAKNGFGSYAEATGLTKGECAQKLLELARKNGAKGIFMECVDYNNYPDDVCQAIKEFK